MSLGSGSGRYHYLDAARGTLMLLGIVFHAAALYRVEAWLLKDPATSPAFDVLSETLTTFRMPAFFLISGFFALLTLSRDRPARFLRKRATRIVVPLIATLLTVNVLQLYVLHRLDGGTLGFMAFLAQPGLWQGFLSEAWVSHLWFLGCLIVYFGVLGSVASLVPAHAGSALASRLERARGVLAQPVVFLLLAPLSQIAALAILKVLPGLYDVRLVADGNQLLEFAPYFLAGLAAYASPALYNSLTRARSSVFLLTVAAVGFRAIDWTPPSTLAGRVLESFVVSLSAWVGIYWVLVFFRSILDRPNRVARTLADASYTIYLFHHVTVILVGGWLLGAAINVYAKFLIVVLATFAITFALHLVVRRIPALSLLYGGKWPIGPQRGHPHADNALTNAS
jgi:glucan biosynthesis protein C